MNGRLRIFLLLESHTDPQRNESPNFEILVDDL